MDAHGQHAFTAALLDPALAVPAGLRSGAGVDPQRRFAVHRNNVAMTLVDALATAFPVTRALVGDDFFRAMARERVFADPPRSPVLTDYGDGFAEFVATFAPAASVPYLADMARLEQRRTRAYHALDAVPADAHAFVELVGDPQRLASTCISLHPAGHWLRSEYAIASIWNAHQLIDVNARHAHLATIDIDRAEDVLVTRPQLEVVVSVLPAGGIELLDALHDGSPLSTAMAHACAAHPDAAIDTLFALLIHHELVINLSAV